VNDVSGTLFKKYRKPADYLKHSLSELEADIRPTGFFRQKAKSLRRLMEELIEKHGGRVPENLDELTKLPGTGRKTANVVLGNAFGVPGIAVDTHVLRVSQRIGLTDEKNPEKIERDLMALLPKKEWTHLTHVLIFHGRYTCKAKKPLCPDCTVTDLCDYFQEMTSSGNSGIL
jgi:endonuclease-3